MANKAVTEDIFDEKMEQNIVIPKNENTQQKDRVATEKSQEAKLRAKYPGMNATPGGSGFLQKRLSKGRVYFDSGEYNMPKAKIDTRASTKVYSREPTRIRSSSTEEDDTSPCIDTKPLHGEKDNPLPEPEETAQQAIPTPELLFLRRASLHMPMSSSEAQNASMSGLNNRRYTTAPKGLLSTEASSSFPALSETEEMPPLFSKNMARRRATLQVPSKLALN